MRDTKEINKSGSKTIKFIIISILIIAVISLIGFAYARYMTSLNGNTQVAIAQCNFNVTAGSSQSLNVDLADTRLANDTTEVDSSKVAPGTKGALALNIDASGSQVSLKYDIDLTLTQIPENLIFYSDSNMTNAIYKENGIIHLDGYFGANDNNKTETKTLYWQWAMETGSTQAEIDANDLLDSAWMGDEIILDIQATGRQVMDNPSTEYTVTFDLNGGKLANHGDSTQVTKQVKYGETYGTLPMPTREGYTFGGWEETLYYVQEWSASGATSENYAVFKTIEDICPNASYRVIAECIELLEGTETEFSTRLFDYTSYNEISNINMPFGENLDYVISCPVGADPTHRLALIFYMGRVGHTSGSRIHIKNLKLTAHYMSSTIMVKKANHTLTANWIKN